MPQRHRVLVVEDDPSTMGLLDQVVKRAGYESILAEGGKEALDLLREEEADLILVDLMMRTMDGWTLLETIKSDERLSPIPVVIVSAKHPSEDPDRTEAHAEMFEAYFVKPFEVSDLVAKMAELLR